MVLDQNRPFARLIECSDVFLVYLATYFQLRRFCNFELENDAELENMQHKVVTRRNLTIFLAFLKKLLKVHIKVTGPGSELPKYD